MKILKSESIYSLEKKADEGFKSNLEIILSKKEIIQDSYDLKLASIIFNSHLPKMAEYTLNNLKIKESFIYLKLNEYVSNASISPKLDESREGFIGKYSDDNLKYMLLKAKNLGSITFEHDINNDKALTGLYSVGDLLKSKGLSHFIQAKNPFVHLKNRIFRAMGMNIYEGKDAIPNIAPNTKFGYDLSSFTFMPASIIGEEGGIFDHAGYYKKSGEIKKDESFKDYLSKGKSSIWAMAKGGVFLGPYSLVGGAGTILLPGTIIGKHSEICLGAIVRGYVPAYNRVAPNADYHCFNEADLNKMLEKGAIKPI